MHFVKPNGFHSSGLTVSEYHGFADNLGLGFLELAENRGRPDRKQRALMIRSRKLADRCLHLNAAQVVTRLWQTRVEELRPDKSSERVL